MGESATARDWREGRRLRAWELKRQGWRQEDIARALGVTAGAVSQWLKRAREGGVEALRHRPPTGACPKLSGQQRALLLAVRARGAEAWQFGGDL